MFNTQNAYFQVHYQGSASQGRQGIPLHTPGGYAASGFIPDNSSSLMQDESTPREAHVMLSRRLADKQVMHIAEPTFPAYSNPQFRPVRHFQTVHDDDIQGTSNSASVMLTPSVSGHNRPVFNVPLPDYDPEFKIGVTVHGRPGKRLWSTRLHEGKSNAVNDTIKSTVDKHDKVLDKLFEDTYICTQTVPALQG
ncbi:hypothetical protein C8Q78DRAFT_1078026 [Trametes maxima]|nr:hypothetical protein C8Q78DRAFT_1078026 [Trametes maxima]